MPEIIIYVQKKLNYIPGYTVFQRYIKILLMVMFIFTCGSIMSVELDLSNSAFVPEYLDTKLPKEYIKAINYPVYESLDNAIKNKQLEFMKDSDWMILVKVDKNQLLFPITIMIWHEIANIRMEGLDLGVTYCILTGSSLVFPNKTSNGQTRSFGVSGKLYNSNLVMYDYQTGSLWAQLDLKAKSGGEKESTLDVYPFSLVRFKYAKRKLPDVPVLIGSKIYPYFDKMYQSRPSELLENYEHNDKIQASVNPEYLENSRYAIKTPFIYFPEQNKAMPLSSLKGKKGWVKISTDKKGSIQTISPRKGKPFITLYWFALLAFYPEADILE